MPNDNDNGLRILVAGCGKRPQPGAVNLDCVAMPGVDVVHDLDAFPYPFADEEFDKVEAEDVIEHLNNPIQAVQEFGRILKVGGTLWVRGPDGNYPDAIWDDLTHKRAFGHRSFSGFDPETYDGRNYGHYHGPIKFKLVRVTEKNRGLEFELVKRG
jgi:SAM-dependent methyltransferase